MALHIGGVELAKPLPARHRALSLAAGAAQAIVASGTQVVTVGLKRQLARPAAAGRLLSA